MKDKIDLDDRLFVLTVIDEINYPTAVVEGYNMMNKILQKDKMPIPLDQLKPYKKVSYKYQEDGKEYECCVVRVF
jgi:hypothetical protein